MRPSMLRLQRGLLDLASAMLRARLPLGDMRFLPLGTAVPPKESPIPSQRAGGWRRIAVGDRWGGADENAWFHTVAEVPAEWAERLGATHAVALRWLLGAGSEDAFGWPEGLLYVNGHLQQGINRHHPDVLLRDADALAGRLSLDVRVWSGMLPMDHRIEYAEITLLDRRIESLYHLLAQGAELVELLGDGNIPLASALAEALYKAYDALHFQEAATPVFERQAVEALGSLREQLANLRTQYDSPTRPTITAVGHGHLDVAWLWQTRHTREKAARTFSIATALMERYPEYRFLHTTPQVFAWLERDYPTLFEKVREAVTEGRFEAAGAMWVESDCNLVSGESLVRQIFYGQRYLQQTFGREYDALWLPDAFGYTAALPQIMLRAGIPVFMTTKMSWSDTNRMPADTFRWRGLDGSEVLAHFITTPTLSHRPLFAKMDTYNGAINAAAVTGLWNRYLQKAISDEVLLAFGHGDGGAGPTRQHLEAARALRELPGAPCLQLGRADEYFHRLRERAWSNSALPVWDGELYLEYHRGTYTTQAWLKRIHRQNESRLLLAEMLDAWQWTVAPHAAPDRRQMLDDAWKVLLLHEFHDILPGSSIGPVYADARAAMSGLKDTLEGIIAQAASAIASCTGAGSAQHIVLNPSPFATTDVVEVPIPPAGKRYACVQSGEQIELSAQVTAASGAPSMLLETPMMPAHGIVGVSLMDTDTRGESSAPATEAARAGMYWLENAYFRVEFDARGEISSLVDKRVEGVRELVLKGRTLNAIQVFDDRPAHFDAWDIDLGYEDKPLSVGPATIEVEETGPLRATLRVKFELDSSTITQRTSLYRGIPRVDFRTTISWRERHVLLKAAFPLDLRARTTTSHVQFGAVERATHRNTSWEQAQFETVAHQWVDLSEGDYGVSLLNDGKYGHDIRDSTIRLTLLRSPTYPDHDADLGEHEVIYSLYPHVGDWRAGGTVSAAYALNRPLRFIPLGPEGSASREDDDRISQLLRVEPVNVVAEAVKRAADGDGLIVRLYESQGSRAVAHIHSSQQVVSVEECDLLERPLRDGASPAFKQWQESQVSSHDVPEIYAGGWSCMLRPFEIRSFRVRPEVFHIA